MHVATSADLGIMILNSEVFRTLCLIGDELTSVARLWVKSPGKSPVKMKIWCVHLSKNGPIQALTHGRGPCNGTLKLEDFGSSHNWDNGPV